MKTFLDRVAKDWREAGGKGGAKGGLRDMYVRRDMSPEEIAGKYGVSVHIVRLRLRKSGLLNRKATFEEQVRKAGHKTVDSFFLGNADRTLKEMGRLVGLTFSGIQYHYRRWLASRGMVTSGATG